MTRSKQTFILQYLCLIFILAHIFSPKPSTKKKHTTKRHKKEKYNVTGRFFDMDLFLDDFKAKRHINRHEIDFSENGKSFFHKHDYDHKKKRVANDLLQFGSKDDKSKTFSFNFPGM